MLTIVWSDHSGDLPQVPVRATTRGVGDAEWRRVARTRTYELVVERGEEQRLPCAQDR
ncbi:hypothetical protein [Saccharopolyspora aridisoli]|uniref:hypothetical protein n=1 Tax=Saccharopolyspora aridisoli TaxID=2530385 RepID=UPI00140426F3|nr:hypothetical protein [Saccharopolyspora aridisoli]